MILFMYIKGEIIMDMEIMRTELENVLSKYGYRVKSCCLDERHGRTSHQNPTLELDLEKIEKPRSFWID